MAFTPIRRGAGRLFENNLNRMLRDLYSPVMPSFSATEIADIDDGVNTDGKSAGRTVWDTTNNRLMVASGPDADDAWYVADGSASVTPA